MSAGYTDADVQLVVDAMAEAVCTCPPGSRCASHEVDAEVALAALAEAGRLTPDGAERRSPYVAINPAMRWGMPTINNTRMPVDAVVGLAWVEGVDVAAEEYDLTRADVLVACWYAGTYGLPGRRQSMFPVRQWPKRWGVWADSVAAALWKMSEVDYAAVPDPPREQDPVDPTALHTAHRDEGSAPK